MTIYAAFSAELRKHPPLTTAVLITSMPIAIAGLKGLGFLIRKKYLLEQGRFHWQTFLQAGHMELVQMLVPLALASWAAYLTWTETEARGWKLILSQPVARANIFLAKLGLLCLWLALFLSCHAVAQLGVGYWLLEGQTPPLVLFLDSLAFAPVFLAPILVIQLWLSLRFTNAIVGLGSCLVANLIVLLSSASWEKALPWHYVQYVGMRSGPSLQEAPYALTITILFLAAALFDFTRKDIL